MIGLIKSWRRLTLMNWHAATMGMDPETGEEAPCVLLVHGFWNNRGVWMDMIDGLARRGVQAATVNLTPPWESIDFFADLVTARLAELQATTPNRKVIAVGHSMGGLVWRRHLAQQGTEGVAALVTLATPHAGTASAHLGLGRCAREMEPEAEWIKTLPKPPKGFPVYSLSAADDLLIHPLESAEPKWAVARRLAGTGHNEIVADPRACALIAALALNGGVLPAGFDLPEL